MDNLTKKILSLHRESTLTRNKPMADFLSDQKLRDKLAEIIQEAKDILIIITPSVRLVAPTRQLLDNTLKEHPNVRLYFVFSRTADLSQPGLSAEDADYLKSLPNLCLVYDPKLNARYYANEKGGLITSLTLDHCNKELPMTEYGVYMPKSLLPNSDTEAFDRTSELIKAGEALFVKRPVFPRHRGIVLPALGAREDKTPLASKIFYDCTKEFYAGTKYTPKSVSDFPYELTSPEDGHNGREASAQQKTESRRPKNYEFGYCIRTGVRIPFDLQMPYCPEAYAEWKKYERPDWKERYCHYSGQLSNGLTSLRHPVLPEYESRAAEKQKVLHPEE